MTEATSDGYERHEPHQHDPHHHTRRMTRSPYATTCMLANTQHGLHRSDPEHYHGPTFQHNSPQLGPPCRRSGHLRTGTDFRWRHRRPERPNASTAAYPRRPAHTHRNARARTRRGCCRPEGRRECQGCRGTQRSEPVMQRERMPWTARTRQQGRAPGKAEGQRQHQRPGELGRLLGTARVEVGHTIRRERYQHGEGRPGDHQRGQLTPYAPKHRRRPARDPKHQRGHEEHEHREHRRGLVANTIRGGRATRTTAPLRTPR